MQPAGASRQSIVRNGQEIDPAPVVLVLGPARTALSGVATHLNALMNSGLAEDFELRHFQVGSEGRQENRLHRWWRLIASPLMLAWRILRERVALVHINSSLNRRAFWRDLAYLLAARLVGARVIYQVHGGSLPAQFCVEQHLPAFMLRAILRLPDVLVLLANNEFKAYFEFAPGLPITVIPNGIDFQPYLAVDRSHRDVDPAVLARPLRLLYIGRLDHEKGLIETLHGLAAAKARGVKATLVLAGGGPDEALLKTTVKSLELAGVVHFVGPVFDDAKRDLLAKADVFLLPSWSEGLPYALLEAMAAGLPVIATRVGAIPDVMTDGIHGIFVPIKDAPAIAEAITRLAGDRAALAAMRPACQRRISRSYSVTMSVSQFERLYRELTSTRQASALNRY